MLVNLGASETWHEGLVGKDFPAVIKKVLKDDAEELAKDSGTPSNVFSKLFQQWSSNGIVDETGCNGRPIHCQNSVV